MGTAAAIAVIVELLQTATALTAAATEASKIVKSAQQNGRDVSPEEFATLVASDDRARSSLEQAIDRARQQLTADEQVEDQPGRRR